MEILNTSRKDTKEILHVCSIALKNVWGNDAATYTIRATDWNNSLKLVDNGKVIGCYLLKHSDLPDRLDQDDAKIDLNILEGFKGLEGVALCLLPEFKGQGLGNKLKAAVKSIPHDYIWGQQMKELNNIENWTKSDRIIAGKTNGIYYTINKQDFERIKMRNSFKRISSRINDITKSHYDQDKEYNCGPSCIKTILKLTDREVDIETIEKACETTKLTGTNDIGIEKCLKELNVPSQRIDKLDPFKSLDSNLSNGHGSILRTLTKGVKHWIVCYGKRGDTYLISDPWLGLIKYDKSQLDKIWKPRDYDGFNVTI